MLHKFRRKEDLRAGGRINIGLSLIPDSRCFGGDEYAEAGCREKSEAYRR
jgi:hypothetical protein